MAQKAKPVYTRSFFDAVRVVVTLIALLPLIYFLVAYFPSIVWEFKFLTAHFSLQQLMQTAFYFKEFVLVPLILLISLFLSKRSRYFVKTLLFVYMLLSAYCLLPGVIENGVPLIISSVPDMSLPESNLGFMNFYNFWADMSIIVFCLMQMLRKKYLIKAVAGSAMLVMNIW